MAVSYNNKILQRGEAEVIELPAGTTIYPGYLLQEDSNGDLQVATGTTIEGELIFAQEDALQGKTTADTYTDGDMVSAIIPKRGAIVLAFLAASTTYKKGDQLMSAGDGTLKKVTGTYYKVLATIVEAITTTSAALGAVRIN